jgi:ubiquinone biosynthesis protein COQ9
MSLLLRAGPRSLVPSVLWGAGGGGLRTVSPGPQQFSGPASYLTGSGQQSHASQAASQPASTPLASHTTDTASAGGQQEQEAFKRHHHRRGHYAIAAHAWRKKLLDTALQRVREDGWSAVALERAAVSIGLSPAASGMLPRCVLWAPAGTDSWPVLIIESRLQLYSPWCVHVCPVVSCRREGELVEHFISCCNRRLQQELLGLRAQGELQPLASTRARLALALRMRLQMLAPVIDTWPQVCTPRGGESGKDKWRWAA